MAAPIEGYERHQRRRELSDETLRRRRITLWSFERWLGRSVVTATGEEIERWLESQPWSVETRRAYGHDLRAFFAWARRAELVDGDPTDDVVLPRPPHALPRPIADADLALAFAHATPRTAALLALGAYQGLRVQEMARLRGVDVDVGRGLLLVRHGKGRRERLLPLQPTALARLEVLGLAPGWLFPSRGGDCPLLANTVSLVLSTHFRAHGIEATAHQLRHWFATNAYRLSGGDLRMVQDLLGHASPLTTARYTAWAPERAAQVLAAFPSSDRNGTVVVPPGDHST